MGYIIVFGIIFLCFKEKGARVDGREKLSEDLLSELGRRVLFVFVWSGFGRINVL